MDGKTYPYLDLAAVPEVGETLLDPRPAFVFAADGSRLLFANAAGAAFFGASSMGTLLKLRFSDVNPIKAQAARLSRVLPSDTSRLEMLRLGQGVALATLPAACRRLNLPGDARGVLAIAADSGGSASITARAERLADVIGANDCLAAVLTADGKVLAASGGYDELAPAEPAIDAMIALAAGERLVKRNLGVTGGTRHAGAVRFPGDGRELFLVIVGPVEAVPVIAVPPVERASAVVETTPVEVTDSAVPAELLFPEEETAEVPQVAEPEPVAAPARVVRFVFEADRDGRFTFVSPELVATVGERDGAVVGHTWTEVAAVLGFNVRAFAGEAFAVDLSWPAGGGHTVPVALDGAPALDPERRVVGYRGFGAIRPDERGIDARPQSKSLDAIVAPAPTAQPVADEVAPAPPAPAAGGDHVDADAAAQWSIEQGHKRARLHHVTRRAEPAAITQGDGSPSNVVRMPGTAPARIPSERLTGIERDAFRRIAEALGMQPAPVEKSETDAATGRKEIAKAPAAAVDTRLLDRLPIGIVLFRDRKTLFANRTLLDLLGYDSYDAFAGAGGAEAIFPGREGLAGSIAEAGGKLAASRRDGTSLPVKAWLHAVSFGGATALMLSLSATHKRDDAGEDALTMELAQVEARADELEAILDTATDGVIVVDGRGKIGNMNRAAEALFGVEATQYLGRYFTDLLADESQKAALDYLDGLAANGVASVLNDGREVIGRVPAGGLIPLFMTMGRIGDSDKFCAVLRDITHWKNVEEELIAARRAAEAANAQKSDFLAKISHEIRTPLNAIIGFSEVMMGERFGPVGNERYRSYLRDIHVSGAHLLSLINDLLDLSKIEAGKLELSFESVPVNAAIQECVAIMQPQANRERIIIRTSLSAEVPSVVADQRSFRQILLNLMSNAVKFTRAGGQVIVSSSLEANGEVVVRIRDTGIGMSEKDIETALKPFRQVAISKDDRDHGTGLGLPLTKALVEANRATFTIDSAVNQGTLVRITFPTTRVLAG